MLPTIQRSAILHITGALTLALSSLLTPNIAYAGLIWGNSAGSNEIAAFDTTTGALVLDYSPRRGNGRGIVTVGNTVYYTVVGDGNIYKFNASTGAHLGSIPTGQSSLSTIAYDGANFWLSDYSGTNQVYKVSQTGTLLKTITLSNATGFTDGLEYFNGKLIANRSDGGATNPTYYDVYGLNGNLLQSAFITAPHAETGIAFDGTDFLTSDIYNDRIDVWNGTTGKFIRSLSLQKPGQLIEDLSVNYAQRPDTNGAPTMAELFSKSVHPTALNGSGAPSITATFHPNLGYSLKQAAQLAGYDHFNWLQIVTRDDALSYPYPLINRGMKDQNGDLPSVPYFDPVAGGYQYQVKSCPQGTTFPVADNLPWYWDEKYTFLCAPSSPSSPPEARSIGVVTTSKTLQFEDKPSTPFGLRADFFTALAGIYPNGTGDILDFPGTIFDWTYSGNILNTSITIRNIDPSLVMPPYGTVAFSGFVNPTNLPSDVLSLVSDTGIGIRGPTPNVSEPPTSALLIVGMLSLGLWTKRRRVQAVTPQAGD